MTYYITHFDTTPLIYIPERQNNTTATPLTLCGYGNTNWGKSFDQNFVYLLEHFKSNTPPSNPIIGQGWYDTSSNPPVLRIYNGSETGSTDILNGWRSIVFEDVLMNDLNDFTIFATKTALDNEISSREQTDTNVSTLQQQLENEINRAESVEGTLATNDYVNNTFQTKLGFTPVQQGTGIGQLNNTIKIGWTGTKLAVTVDDTSLGNIWNDNASALSTSSFGYTKLPNGLIIQWGTTNIIGRYTNVPYPVTFPNAILNVIVCEGHANGSWGDSPQEPTIHSVDLSSSTTSYYQGWAVSWNGSSWSNGTITQSFIAIGY